MRERIALARAKADGSTNQIRLIGLDPMLGRPCVLDQAWPLVRLRLATAIAGAHLPVSHHVQVADAVGVVKQGCAAQRSAVEHPRLQGVAAEEGGKTVLRHWTMCIELRIY